MLWPAELVWRVSDTWIVVVGALAAMSCGLLGVFLLLRRMSMFGDALSHAVLPGLAAAFLISGSRASVIMLLGAVVVGVLTAAATEWIRRAGAVEENASMGVVFTILFALGLIMIRFAVDDVDLDPDCVLYGAIELTPLDQISLLGFDLPRAAVTSGGLLLVNLLVVGLLYKELKLAAFDPALATTLGFSSRTLHYVLMVLIAVTAVVAFESVGSILVIAMLIVPAAAAHLLSDRLPTVLVLSVLLGGASAPLGHVAALITPTWFGFTGVTAGTAGMMAVLVGVFLFVAVLFAPRHGLILAAWRRLRLGLKIVREDLLGVLYRLEEEDRRPSVRDVLRLVSEWSEASPYAAKLALASARRRRLVADTDDSLSLTDRGRSLARELLRSHRLWETYVDQHTPTPRDHLHFQAEQLEHVTGPELRERLARDINDPGRDPHGHQIPPRKEEPS